MSTAGKPLTVPNMSLVLMVGASGLLVHMAVLYGAMGLGGSFAWAQAAAAVSAMTFNFALNNALTFPDRRFRGWGLLRGWAAYLAVCSVGLVANVSVARWAYDQFQGWAALAALAGIAMDVMWKFVTSRQPHRYPAPPSCSHSQAAW